MLAAGTPLATPERWKLLASHYHSLPVAVSPPLPLHAVHSPHTAALPQPPPRHALPPPAPLSPPVVHPVTPRTPQCGLQRRRQAPAYSTVLAVEAAACRRLRGARFGVWRAWVVGRRQGVVQQVDALGQKHQYPHHQVHLHDPAAAADVTTLLASAQRSSHESAALQQRLAAAASRELRLEHALETAQTALAQQNAIAQQHLAASEGTQAELSRRCSELTAERDAAVSRAASLASELELLSKAQCATTLEHKGTAALLEVRTAEVFERNTLVAELTAALEEARNEGAQMHLSVALKDKEIREALDTLSVQSEAEQLLREQVEDLRELLAQTEATGAEHSAARDAATEALQARVRAADNAAGELRHSTHSMQGQLRTADSNVALLQQDAHNMHTQNTALLTRIATLESDNARLTLNAEELHTTALSANALQQELLLSKENAATLERRVTEMLKLSVEKNDQHAEKLKEVQKQSAALKAELQAMRSVETQGAQLTPRQQTPFKTERMLSYGKTQSPPPITATSVTSTTSATAEANERSARRLLEESECAQRVDLITEHFLRARHHLRRPVLLPPTPGAVCDVPAAITSPVVFPAIQSPPPLPPVVTSLPRALPPAVVMSPTRSVGLPPMSPRPAPWVEKGVPSQLRVETAQFAQASGQFVLSAAHSPLRGLPVWTCGDRTLFAGAGGRWLLGANAGSMEKNRGCIRSAALHQNRLPHTVAGWEAADGKGGWVTSPVTVLPAEQSSLEAASRYGPQIQCD